MCLFCLPEEYSFEMNEFNADAGSTTADPDELIEWNEKHHKPLLFRGGFYRFLRRDGVTIRVECLNCHKGNVYIGHSRSNSNLLKHLRVRFIVQTSEKNSL